MNDIRKNLDSLAKLDEGPLGTELLKRLATRQLKPTQVTEIPPFDPQSPAAQSAAAVRKAKQQQAQARIRGDAPENVETKSTILGPDGRPLTVSEPPPQVFRPTQRGPGYKSPYDEELPSGLDTLPAADSDILKGIEAAKSTPKSVQPDYSKLARTGRWAQRKLIKHTPDINTAAAGAAAYNVVNNWDEIKKEWDKRDLTNKLGIGTAEEFLAGQIKNLNDFFGFSKTPVKESSYPPGDMPTEWIWDPKIKGFKYTGSGRPSRVNTQLTVDEFQQEIMKPYMQSIQNDPEFKRKKKWADQVWKASQGKSLVGHILNLLNPKKAGKIIIPSLSIGTAAEFWAPHPYKPTDAWRRAVEKYTEPDDQPKPQPTTSTPASTNTNTPVQPPPTAVPQTTTTQEKDRTKTEIPNDASPTSRPNPFNWGTGRGTIKSNENACQSHKKYVVEFKRYIKNV